jgi:ABC-type lipoprotein export system ATPase subunit
MNERGLALKQIVKEFRQGPRTLAVLQGVDLDVAPGEWVAIMGPSGAGKSTLLHIAGGLMRPTAGSVVLDGSPVEELDDAKLSRVRNRRIGFVFQFHHLLPEFSALENVALPAKMGKTPDADADRRARELLARMGLTERLDHRPGELSGGEQQRVAIARALMNDPAVLLADEPTGDLDAATARDIHALLQELHRQEGRTILMVTHNPDLSALADRIVTLRDGRVAP